MKARLPKGYGNGGANNIQQLARQAQKLQDDMEQASQGSLRQKNTQLHRGGGAVSVTLTGKMELTKIDISPDVVERRRCRDAFRAYYCSYKRGLRSARKKRKTQGNYFRRT